MKYLFIIGLVVALLIGCGEKDKPVAVQYPYVDSIASFDSTMISYKVYSQSEKNLIFVHCWCCDMNYWQNQVDPFSKEYGVVTVDLAGHGLSDIDRNDWTIEAYGQDVAAVAEKLGMENIILVGHSMGGMVVLETAKRLGKKVVAIVGVDIYQKLGREFAEESKMQFLKQFEDDFLGYSRTYVSTIFDSLSDTSVVNWIVDDMSSQPAEIGIASMRAILDYDFKAPFDSISVPLRGIDGSSYPADVEENIKIAGDYKTVVIDGTGHFPHLEKPDEFNKALTETIVEFWPAK